MDRTELSASSTRELGDLFMELLQQAAPELLRSDIGGIERRTQALARVVVGRVVETIVQTIVGTQVEMLPGCLDCDERLRLVGHARERALAGLAGDNALCRTYFYCDDRDRGRAPPDERLGLDGGSLSPGLGRVTCRVRIEGGL